MNRLQLVMDPLCGVLPRRKPIGGSLGQEVAMLYAEVLYKSGQTAREGADGCGGRTQPLNVTPVILDAHVVVSPGISGMRQAVASLYTGPVSFILGGGTRLSQVLAGICHQELLRVIGEGEDRNILHSHRDQLLVKHIIFISAIFSIEVLDVGSVCHSYHELCLQEKK